MQNNALNASLIILLMGVIAFNIIAVIDLLRKYPDFKNIIGNLKTYTVADFLLFPFFIPAYLFYFLVRTLTYKPFNKM